MKIKSLSLMSVAGQCQLDHSLKPAMFQKKSEMLHSKNLQLRIARSGIKHRSANNFVLVYPDGSLVYKLPESQNFLLLGYRNSIDPYKRIYRLRLYLYLSIYLSLNMAAFCMELHVQGQCLILQNLIQNISFQITCNLKWN